MLRITTISILSFFTFLFSFGQRAHGTSRFDNYGETKIQHRDNGQKIYYFDITEEKREYWMPKKKPPIDVFAWDTLSRESVMEPWIFRIRNKTDHSIFITDITNSTRDIFIERTSKHIKIDSNDYVEVIARVNPYRAEHFYTTLKVECLHPTGFKTFDIHQWGYRDKHFTQNLSSSDSLYMHQETKALQAKTNDPIKVYISDGKYNIHKDLTLTVRTKDKTFYLKKIANEEEPFFLLDLDRKLWDTLFLQVVNPEGKIISKSELVGRNFKNESFIIFAFPEKWNVPYFFSGGQIQPFEPIKSVYQLTYNYELAKNNKLTDINTYLKINGVKQQVDGRGFIFISTFEEALKLERKLATLKYQIKLLPVFHYSTLNEHGWGGDCSWLSDQVGIYFYESVSHERRIEILKSFDFTHTHKSYGSKDLVYYIKLRHVLDRKYMKQLNHLYQQTEVKRINHQTSGYAGLD